MSPLVKLVWFSQHEPELARQVRWWAGLKDYVLHHLTGDLVTELSSASGTGLLNLKNRSWDAQSLDLAGVKAAQLPPVLPTTAVRKLTAQVGRECGLPAGLPVVVGAADGPLGNLGTGAITLVSRAFLSAPVGLCGWSCPSQVSTSTASCSAMPSLMRSG
jgi:gluconokinase